VINNPEKFTSCKPKAIGGLTIREKQREYIGSLPFDVLPLVGSMLSADKYKYLIFHGHALFRGSADIHSLYFKREFDEEEW